MDPQEKINPVKNLNERFEFSRESLQTPIHITKQTEIVSYGIKKYFKKFIWIFSIFLMFYFFINIFNYFSPLNFCYIKIDGDFLRGNEKTIRKAIKLLKKENKQAYNTLCGYINTISEKNCYTTSQNISREEREKDGCYIKGSKVIYLKPEKGENNEVINKRKNAIKKYSEYSKDFWWKTK